MSALNRKLWRELARLKGQVLTIAIVLAGGITCFIALRGTYASLESAREAYYDRYRFAHIFARLERAPDAAARQIEALAGVSAAQTRIAEEVTLPIEGMPRPAYARLLSLPPSAAPATNGLSLQSGRLPAGERGDEVAVLASFAEAHGLLPGDRLPVVINGKLRKLRIAGLVLSPEFVYAIRPGALVDDPKRYAVLWMDQRALGAAFQMEGAFNEVSLRLEPEASESNVRAELDHILGPYGGDGAIGRKDQMSNRILTQELSQLRALAGMVPMVFLGVAAFLINLVLGRLIRLQRGEIATLKAIGYSNAEVGRHYLGLVAVVLVPGWLLGVLGGRALGHFVLALYAGLFRFPDLAFNLSGTLVGSAILASGVGAVAGALLAVRAAVKLPPAEAMRPPAPAHYRRSLVERLGLAALAGPSGMMVLREIQRRPLRTALSSLGIGGAIALIVLGHFGIDSLSSYLEGTYRREQRQDLAVSFVKPLAPRAVSELARLPGVITAEGIRAVPIRASHEHRMRDSLLLGLPSEANLRRLVERGGQSVELPADGVLASKKLAEILGLKLGDRVELQVREGNRPLVKPVVLGFVDETMGLQLYGRTELIANLEHDIGAVSSVLLKVNRNDIPGVEERLRRSPAVIDVSDLGADVERLYDMNGQAMDIWTAVSITLSACIIFGVVYNNARISLAARGRDLASLRVLGFSRAEISSVLIGSLAFELGLAIPIGLLLGARWAKFFMDSSLDQETVRWLVVIAPRTYLMAAAVAVAAGAASALWVRRSLDHLDLISVLKTRE